MRIDRVEKSSKTNMVAFYGLTVSITVYGISVKSYRENDVLSPREGVTLKSSYQNRNGNNGYIQ